MTSKTNVLRGIAVPDGTVLHFGRTESLVVQRAVSGVRTVVEWVPTTQDLRRDARSHAPNSVAEHLQLPVQPTPYGPARLIGYSPTFGRPDQPMVSTKDVKREIRNILRPTRNRLRKGNR